MGKQGSTDLRVSPNLKKGKQGRPNWSKFFKGETSDPRTAHLVAIFKGDQGIHGPSVWSKFKKGKAGIHGTPNRSKFLKEKAGTHGPPI